MNVVLKTNCNPGVRLELKMSQVQYYRGCNIAAHRSVGGGSGFCKFLIELIDSISLGDELRL